MDRIKGVEAIVVGERGSAATWASVAVIVRVETSSGRVGYGEAVPTLRTGQVVEATKRLASVVVGMDPHAIELVHRTWMKEEFYLHRSIESTAALSALDIALWDLKGREFGAPIHELLGGAYRSRVLSYANGWYGNCRTPGDFAEAASRVVKMGYRGLKFDPFGGYFDYIDGAGVRRAAEIVSAVRDAVGDDVHLMIEHHGRFSYESAVRIADAISRYSPLFMEEPVHPYDLEGLRRYRSLTRVPVALGERILNKEEALQYLREGLVDFLQVDLTNVGGVTEAWKIAALADSFGVKMAYHNAFGPVQNAATLQLDATVPNFMIQETFYDFFPQWKRDLIGDATKVVDGYHVVPDGPGIGVDVREDVLESHRAEGLEERVPGEPVWVVRGTWVEDDASRIP
ncbi:MAG: enolase C-terminal domain-like protein [Conexivisphaera sp.]|jgi:L-alanine-DL-glutamate epimerase-like enolase superfamily enzyme|nr:mandelate racemase/muconate lactonizing enzyme family protein [Conexivisphaerales archaeon]